LMKEEECRAGKRRETGVLQSKRPSVAGRPGIRARERELSIGSVNRVQEARYSLNVEA
jgi:hypothetical protein